MYEREQYHVTNTKNLGPQYLVHYMRVTVISVDVPTGYYFTLIARSYVNEGGYIEEKTDIKVVPLSDVYMSCMYLSLTVI